MKVALLISGLARKVKEGYDQYFSSIINEYDTDVYLHYWEDGEWEDVLKVYSPKKHICVKPFSFQKHKEGVATENDLLARPIYPYDVAGNYTSLPMFYGWQSVYSLIDGEYDCIIRSRYDMGWPEKINLTKFDLNRINVTNMHWNNSPIIDDNIFITNQTIASAILSDVFDVFTNQIKRNGVIYFPERNFTNILLEKDIYKYIHKSNSLNFNLLREFKIWY
jgi:hypothetical protein